MWRGNPSICSARSIRCAHIGPSAWPSNSGSVASSRRTELAEPPSDSRASLSIAGAGSPSTLPRSRTALRR